MIGPDVDRRRYRKIHVRVHGDEKFRQLSRPQPNGQSLWFYLMTGPHTTIIPGLFVTGPGRMADELGWPVADVRRCLGEIEALGMAEYDETAHLVWLPNAVHYNRPESPNVVRAWVSAFDELPECPLKSRAGSRLRAFVEALGDGFAAAVPAGFGKASRKASRKASGKASRKASRKAKAYQEQEQEQEQDTKSAGPRPGGRHTELSFEAVRPQLRAAAHGVLDRQPHAAESDISEELKRVAARMGVSDYSGRGIASIVDAVRGVRARRAAGGQ